MKYTEAIAAIQSSELENKGDIVAALNSHTSELTEDRDKHKKAAEDINKNLEVITAAAGQVEGELSDRLAGTVTTIKNLTTKNKELTDKIAEQDAQTARAERDRTIDKVSAISGADAAVLKTLLSDQDELVVSEEKKTVTVNGISYEDWAGKDERKAFKALLTPDKKPDLPGGGRNSQNNQQGEGKDSVDSYLAQRNGVVTNAKA